MRCDSEVTSRTGFGAISPFVPDFASPSVEGQVMATDRAFTMPSMHRCPALVRHGTFAGLARWGAAARCAVAALALSAVTASAQTPADDAAVRAALASCVEDWNRHDPKAFGDVCLTEDIWFSETNDSFYKRFQGREKVLGTFGYNIQSSDLQWDVVRVKVLSDATAEVQLKQRVGILPVTNGRYAQTFDSDPSFARLRRVGGAWKIFFFTSDAGWARSLMQAQSHPASAAAASATPVAVNKADARVPPGSQPPAYAIQFGARSESCFACHGRQPTVSEDGDRGRIVASGAAAGDADALRRAMTTPRAGGIMDRVLADPALSDERLDAIRVWLRAMRDGRAEQKADRLEIHNPRSERDPPARLALLRAEGWTLPRGAGCRQGAELKGGTQCEIRVPPGSRGSLVFRFAASPALQPQEVRLAVDAR
jgi:cytochrome c553